MCALRKKANLIARVLTLQRYRKLQTQPNHKLKPKPRLEQPCQNLIGEPRRDSTHCQKSVWGTKPFLCFSLHLSSTVKTGGFCRGFALKTARLRQKSARTKIFFFRHDKTRGIKVPGPGRGPLICELISFCLYTGTVRRSSEWRVDGTWKKTLVRTLASLADVLLAFRNLVSLVALEKQQQQLEKVRIEPKERLEGALIARIFLTLVPCGWHESH